MIARSIYEILPTSYLLVGGSTIVLHQESIAVVLALLVFVLGARIYNLRSKNRRTDPRKRRKHGLLPEALYDQVPFIYLLSAALLLRFSPVGIGGYVAAALLCYALYLLMQRSHYRKHQSTATNKIF
ncbi:hypothetical protein TUM4644_36460 [Shewanella colwelliana]|uniref:Uncharacterized protein n=1 Tax=Shewanella colwelliana TaxID=23 RepID=A0A1E5IQN4_SHECO|nr:hypothetical protein [Shewanella colwelliana]MDX1280604.1 hypothetical protein [Shewanella colwelliana]OEG72810.1 hypothetical protein BEL05_11105 [Shewanella colwelliana]GIU35221.1 hypothetical protein TUM4644_36460 [Shewanella colwelliana]GIU41831.1 hypothetical protein TUM3794_23740 [Shewanella colwelliana]